MFYTIYEVKNTVNNKIYIGKHQTEVINDRYFGSGRVLVNAIKKYGKDKFTKTVLHVYETEEEMNRKEKEIITKEFIYRRDTYNIGLGGEGGPQFTGHKHTKETKQLLRELRAKQSPPSAETKAKISLSGKGRKVSKETREKLSKKTTKRFEDLEVRNKLSKTMKKHFSNNNTVNGHYTRTSKYKQKIGKIISNNYAKLPVEKKRIWIMNVKLNKQLMITNEELPLYELEGFVRGRL